MARYDRCKMLQKMMLRCEMDVMEEKLGRYHTLWLVGRCARRDDGRCQNHVPNEVHPICEKLNFPPSGICFKRSYTNSFVDSVFKEGRRHGCISCLDLKNL